MLDYRERRQVSVNRPKSQGMARYFVLTAVVGVIAGYGLGVASGWVIFRAFHKDQEAHRQSRTGEVTAKSSPVTAPVSRQGQTPVTSARSADPNYTFYKTLPEGKPILGTGLNLPKPEPAAPKPSPPKPVSPAATASPAATTAAPPSVAKVPAASPERRAEPAQEKAAPPGSPEKPAGTGAEAEQTSKKVSLLKGKYVVQVTSYQSRAEAEAVRTRFSEAGFSAYIVESAIKDKGTWYRVRIGRHLDPAAAAELASKAGKGAIVILE